MFQKKKRIQKLRKLSRKHLLIQEFDEDDMGEEFNCQTQAHGEKIVEYLIEFKLIVCHIRTAPNLREQLKLAYENLSPVYLRFMAGPKVTSCD